MWTEVDAHLVRFSCTRWAVTHCALPTLRAATDPAALGGQYYGPDGFIEQRGNPKIVASSEQSNDLDLQRRLWSVSEELTAVIFTVT
ncbi:hypothetical protein HNP40_004066 [Mycobacteroides chelonae]|nr:hypothetical protein [Mycobacteroides chelonae]